MAKEDGPRSVGVCVCVCVRGCVCVCVHMCVSRCSDELLRLTVTLRGFRFGSLMPVWAEAVQELDDALYFLDICAVQVRPRCGSRLRVTADYIETLCSG